MNEPLNRSMGATNFSGKSYNKHPYWQNEPLRLTQKEREDPLLVFQEFFECYHLHEVRETLWEWLVEVISSRNSISNDGDARNNHIFFYEKLEEVLEACFVLQKSGEVAMDVDTKIELGEKVV